MQQVWTGDEMARMVSNRAKPAHNEPPLELMTSSMGSPGAVASSQSKRFTRALAESSVTSPSRKRRRCESNAADSSSSVLGGVAPVAAFDSSGSAPASGSKASEWAVPACKWCGIYALATAVIAAPAARGPSANGRAIGSDVGRRTGRRDVARGVVAGFDERISFCLPHSS
eukprot:scaffold195245_cov27-Tisochrysis_lutea.AAC.1